MFSIGRLRLLEFPWSHLMAWVILSVFRLDPWIKAILLWTGRSNVERIPLFAYKRTVLDQIPLLSSPQTARVSFGFPGRSRLSFYGLSPLSAPPRLACELARLLSGHIPIDTSREELAH